MACSFGQNDAVFVELSDLKRKSLCKVLFYVMWNFMLHKKDTLMHGCITPQMF